MTKKIVLVDGSSYLFRAYHALPPLINAKGHPTGAIYGVVKMLKNLLDDYQPDFFAVVFDAKGKTFRHKMYPQYKANRKKIDEDLVIQIQPLHEIIRALGYPILIYSGVEADDVLGTLAYHATAQGLETVISTGDKDLAQLVNPSVSLINTMNNAMFDENGVFDKFGVRPNQMIDFLTLTGDTSDNIPGVNKVGPKTASKWLNEYQDLDNIIANSSDFKGKIGEYLRMAIDENVLELSKKLVTIDCAVPLEHTIEKLTIKPSDNQLLAEFYREFQFKQWLSELDFDDSDTPKIVEINTPEVPKIAVNYETILSKSSLDKWCQKLQSANIISIDTETTSLNVMQAELVGISFSVEVGEAAYLPLRHDNPLDDLTQNQLDFKSAVDKLRPILADKTIKKVGQNLKYDKSIFEQSAIEINGISDDTMLQSYVWDSIGTRHNLDALTKKYLNITTTSFEELAGKGKNQMTFNQIEIKRAGFYAAEDADISLRLYQFFTKKYLNEPKLYDLYRNIEIPLIEVLSRIEQNGVLVDVPKLLNLSQNLGMQIVEIEAKAYELAGEKFNLASPKQIQTILFEKMQIPVVKKTPKGQPSTAEEVLQELAKEYELPKLLLQHRSLGKLKSTYADALPKQVNSRTGRIHTSYHQAVTSTGRLSSSNPNLQNIPIRSENGRKIRQAFIAKSGKILIAADYSQIELRIMAEISGDESLLNAFRNNVDIHTSTASEVFGVPLDEVNNEQRRNAKAINFGLIYGMSAFGLAKQIQVSQKEAAEYIELYFSRYTKVRNYMENTKIFAQKNGFVETLFGRRLFLPDINNKNANRRKYAERIAINAPMQGTAADLIKKAMVEVDKKLTHFVSMMIMQVHDELVLEVPIEESKEIQILLKETMENVAKLSVPLTVDIGVGNNWDEAH